MADVRARCEAEGRDPATLRFSVYTRDEDFLAPGAERAALIRAFADIGVDRLICFPTKRQPTLEAQARFAEDCIAAGIELAGVSAVS